MQLQRIQAQIAAYREGLGQSALRYVWDVQADFQRHWDLGAADLEGMFDRSIQSQVNRRLWNREHFQPKAVMLHFIRLEPDQVRLMFRDLFQQEKDLSGRIGRFRFMADEMLDLYRSRGRRPLLAGHDQNEEAMSLYLALRYPGQCAPYDHGAFVAALRDFQVKDIPVQADVDRWFKVARTLQGFLIKDQALMEAYEAFLGDRQAYPEGTLLLAWDFVRFVAWGSPRAL